MLTIANILFIIDRKIEMEKLHLICNAHLDPVWQWEWEEGLGAVISTFTVAVELCEQSDGFVFNHNEALLYQWVEEYAPELFEKIQRLVQNGKWHIMGGWFLQPDCNMPSGESLVRQILVGREYFKRKFDVTPTTAYNIDTFGHSRGLVQILKKSGYDSYVCMRPGGNYLEVPYVFDWVGYDGSEIKVCRIDHPYNTLLGTAAQSITEYIDSHQDIDVALRCWGIGDHGGGPSKIDLKQVSELIGANSDVEIIHSTPEQFFEDYIQSVDVTYKLAEALNPQFVGCYTSQCRIKNRHRKLENEFYSAEKMVSNLAIVGTMDYPKADFEHAHTTCYLVSSTIFCQAHQ